MNMMGCRFSTDFGGAGTSRAGFRLTRLAVAKVTGSTRALTQFHVDSVLDALYGLDRSAHFDLPRGAEVEISHGEFLIHGPDALRPWPEIEAARPGAYEL